MRVLKATGCLLPFYSEIQTKMYGFGHDSAYTAVGLPASLIKTLRHHISLPQICAQRQMISYRIWLRPESVFCGKFCAPIRSGIHHFRVGENCRDFGSHPRHKLLILYVEFFHGRQPPQRAGVRWYIGKACSVTSLAAGDVTVIRCAAIYSSSERVYQHKRQECTRHGLSAMRFLCKLINVFHPVGEARVRASAEP